MLRVGDNTFRRLKAFQTYLLGVLEAKHGYAKQMATDAETDDKEAYWRARGDAIEDIHWQLASAVWEDDAPFALGVIAVGALIMLGTVWSLSGSGWIAAGVVGGYLGICGLVAWWRA